MTVEEKTNKAEELSNFFIESVATWTSESEKKAYEYKSNYLWDFSFSLFEEISEEDRKEIVTDAENLVGNYED